MDFDLSPQESRFDVDALAKLPTGPGVYLMVGQGDEILYVGKAASLRQRVRQYFHTSGDGRAHIEYLRRHVQTVRFVVTGNEKEAFLLENTLIKRHQPRYNIRLRDDKTYVSLRFRMSHSYPRLEVVRVRGKAALEESRKGGAKRGQRSEPDRYFGPYDSAHSVRETMRFLQKVFPVRTCKDSVFSNRTRPCILYDVGKCCGPCTEPVERAEYGALVDQATSFLQGKSADVREILFKRMMDLSESMEFEKAALVRDRLQAVDRTLEAQATAGLDVEDLDLVAVASDSGRSLVLLHEWRNGTLVHVREHYVRNYDRTDREVLYAFMQQHYSGLKSAIPPRVFCALEPEDAELLEEWLRAEREGAVELRVPQRGDWLKRAQSLAGNAALSLQRNLAGEQNQGETTSELQKRLGLPREPRVIECVDISNIMGMLAVGALVRFENGEPDKAGWRLYRIRTVEGANDFAMMKEVLSRRFDPESSTARPIPDLLLVDGGKGQLAVAEEVVRELGLQDKVMLGGIAKSRMKLRDAKGRVRSRKTSPGAASAEVAMAAEASTEYTAMRTEERVFLPGRKNPVTFPVNSPALHLIVRIRDETHRSAITYHRNLRAKTNRRSILDEIPGVGPRRKKALLRAFGSLSGIRERTMEEIAAVDGIGMSAAESIFRFLRAADGDTGSAETNEEAYEDLAEPQDGGEEEGVQDAGERVPD